MKTFLLLLACAVPVCGQVELSLLAIKPAAPSTTYLLQENFSTATTGYQTAWVESGATINPVSTAFPANDTQNLALTKNSGSTPSITSTNFGLISDGEIFFMFRTDEIANQKQILSLYSNSLEVASLYIRASGDLQIYDEWLFFQASPSDNIAANTTYYGWARFNFAATNCIIAYSTDQTKPGNGSPKWASATLTGVSTFNKIELKTTYNPSVLYFDKVRVDAAPIGSSPP